MLVALIIFRVFAVPSMKRYDSEVGLDSTWNSPVGKRNGVGAWLLALAVGVAVIVTLIAQGVIVINPVRGCQRVGVRDRSFRCALLYLPVHLCRFEP
ncbi:peptide transport protein [Citrobacter freundii]|nr:peptide transport protein [Citrobacter freundii]